MESMIPAYLSDISFLKSEPFRVSFAIATTALGIWIKTEARHPEKQMFKKEDFAVGVQMIQSACVTFAMLMVKKALDLHEAMTTTAAAGQDATVRAAANDLSTFFAFSTLRLMIMLLILFGVTSVVRRLGWKTKDDMNITTGIALPLAVGLICLYTVVREA